MAEEAAIALVDTHTHLNDEKFAGDVEETIARARAAGVTRLINMGDTLASSERAVALAASHEGLYAGVGIHPEEAYEMTAADDAPLPGGAAGLLVDRGAMFIDGFLLTGE